MIDLTLSDVTIVSVCYRSDAIVNGMIGSIPEPTPIILVNNGQSNKFDNLPRRSNIQIIELTENEGFGRGCNAGANVCTTPWILFLNPDAELTAGAIEALLSAAERYTDASAFNPRIANSDHSEYFKHRSWLLPRRKYMKRGWPKSDIAVPVLSGSAFFVSAKLFRQIGGFDPEIFLYHEDDDLSLRLSQLGSLMFVREALVIHSSGHSSGRSPDVARLKAYHMAKSRIYTGIKHRRPVARLSTLLQAVLLILSPYTIFSPRRRAKGVGFLEGAVSEILFNRPRMRDQHNKVKH
ncbi:glycosyltransferase family 2 protein [Rhizobium rhizogenes]|uniref:glycosyltransferase family 2 protein n=1 Tax=Rhizobium rhizogenes TaxID=359 RepID=UPI0022BC927A|nr:glycosyltransferase family 2 protein [Rhizobium rhizogenes]MCZ7489110.1 glycosyltransferase family 2 protein [Rhizobium rhizogenes]